MENATGLLPLPRSFGIAALFAFCLASIAMAQLRMAPSARPAPTTVKPFHGQYCASVGPPGWAVIAENPQRVAFGADLMNADGSAYAGYSIFGAGSLTMVPGAETPDRAVTSALTNLGTTQTRFGARRQLGPNVFLIEYQSATNHGVGYYQVIPAGAGGYMIVLRTAGTGNAPGMWQKKAAEAMAVARSLHCQVPNVPPAPDPPSLNAKPRRATGDNGEPDTLYNQWLGMEYYHNSQTGENYWVSPSHDWSKDGPEGPGYYAPHGNTIIKLDPGYSQ